MIGLYEELAQAKAQELQHQKARGQTNCRITSLGDTGTRPTGTSSQAEGRNQGFGAVRSRHCSTVPECRLPRGSGPEGS